MPDHAKDRGSSSTAAASQGSISPGNQLSHSSLVYHDDQVGLLTAAQLSSSQVTLLSTEDPNPEDDSVSIQTEPNPEPQGSRSTIIPSSVSPPSFFHHLPLLPTDGHSAAVLPAAPQPSCGTTGRSAPSVAFSVLASPPATVALPPTRGRISGFPTHSPFTLQSVLDATSDDLKAMIRSAVAENQRLRTEAAHHQIEFNLLAIQADEDSKRAEVELKMMRAEVHALRHADHERRARRELSSAAPSSSVQAKYLQLRLYYDEAVADNDALRNRLQVAKTLILEKEEAIFELRQQNDTLLNRIRENREHFRELCSPGGIFHQAWSPKQLPLQQHQQTSHQRAKLQEHHRQLQEQLIYTPRQRSQLQHQGHPDYHMYTPTPPRRQTPTSMTSDRPHAHHQHHRQDRDYGQERFTALLQVLSQENNSAPSTPLPSALPAPPVLASYASRHSRNVQSLSSLPTTPTPAGPRGHRGQHAGLDRLLPPAHLVPQTEPARHYSSRHHITRALSSNSRGAVPHQLLHTDRGRSSRESTISAEDAQEGPRQPASFDSHPTRQHHSGPLHSSDRGLGYDDADVFESRASMAASELLRQDPLESVEISSSTAASRDQTPASPMLLPPLAPKLAGLGGKRKEADLRRELPTSSSKRLKMPEDLGPRNGIGLKYVP